jgi:hypothetical protein
MAERLAFLLGKDPASDRGGDMTMFRTLRAIVEERYASDVICLSDEPTRHDVDVVRVHKPAVAPARLAARSVVSGRSLVHTRFDVAGLREAVRGSAADRFVAVHSYMAEPFLGVARERAERDLFVSTEVSEADVWRTRGPFGRLEAVRLRRDELRVASRVRAVGGYDRAEMAELAASGVRAHWLPLTLPPATPVDVVDTPPRLVLLGNRTWGPNAQAARTMVRWWPQVADGIADAELWVVGPRGDDATGTLPHGVTDLGAVDDVDATLAQCRGLVAPVSVGGGVRVKVLEAAARGLPVVCTDAAVGSIESTLGLVAARGAEAFISRCRSLLLDAAAAAEEGARLHAANAQRWIDRVGQDAVHEWLSA